MTKSLAPVLRGRLGICGSSRSLAEDVIQNILMNFDRQIRELGLFSAEPGRSGDRCGDTSINLNDRERGTVSKWNLRACAAGCLAWKGQLCWSSGERIDRHRPGRGRDHGDKEISGELLRWEVQVGIRESVFLLSRLSSSQNSHISKQTGHVGRCIYPLIAVV
jgi:hypothetical protein